MKQRPGREDQVWIVLVSRKKVPRGQWSAPAQGRMFGWSLNPMDELRGRQLLQPCMREALEQAWGQLYWPEMLSCPRPWRSLQVQMGLGALVYHFLHFGGYYLETAIVAFGTDTIFMCSMSFSTSTQMFFTVAKTEFLSSSRLFSWDSHSVRPLGIVPQVSEALSVSSTFFLCGLDDL